MTTRVHVTGPYASFKSLVRLIEENRVSAIPIVDQQGVPIGIVSESDLLLKERRRELSSEDLLHLQKRRDERGKAEGSVASEIMTSPVVTVPLETSLNQAARVMEKRGIRRLVVVDKRGRIAGIVSRSDLLKVFLRTDRELHDEIANTVIPALLISLEDTVVVEVHLNMVTLSGDVDRKSDVEILMRTTRELDGVVGVVNNLSFKWDDSVALPVAPASLRRDFRQI